MAKCKQVAFLPFNRLIHASQCWQCIIDVFSPPLNEDRHLNRSQSYCTWLYDDHRLYRPTYYGRWWWWWNCLFYRALKNELVLSTAPVACSSFSDSEDHHILRFLNVSFASPRFSTLNRLTLFRNFATWRGSVSNRSFVYRFPLSGP